MKTNEESKVILKQWVRVLLIVIILCVMGGAVYSIVKAVKPEKVKH